MAFKPHGIVVPIVTPVTQDGKFNEKAYRDLIEYLASSGIHGVFPFGTTGEFYAHDMGFYREVLAVTKDAVRGRMDIYAGANNITTRGAVEIAKAVEQVGGIDALSVLTPMFVSQTQYEVSEYYREIASETNLPIIIYNNRPKTNVTVEPATVAKLAEIDNIIGVKDSTGDMTNTEEYLRLTRGMDNFHVMMGRDTLIYAALCYGASGAIASCANVRRELRWISTRSSARVMRRARWMRSSVLRPANRNQYGHIPRCAEGSAQAHRARLRRLREAHSAAERRTARAAENCPHGHGAAVNCFSA